MKRPLSAGLVFVSLLFPLLLQAASAPPKRGGTVTFAISKDLVLMNPLVATGSTERRLRELAFEPLLGIDLKGNIHPNLAEAWEVSKDGKLYAFKLRKEVKFHNGQEMTAEDVKYAIDYTMNPKNGASGFKELALIERVEVLDRHALRVHLKTANPASIYTFAEIRAFSVVPKGSLPEGISKIPAFPPGTGPFKFVEWQPQRRIVFERYDDYWGHKAFIDRVILRPISDDTVRLTALQAGDIDITERAPYEWVKEIKEGKTKGIGFVEAPYSGATRIEFNVADPPFNNRKLRLAVGHAINRKEMLQAAYFGLGEPTDQRYPKGHVWYFDAVRSPAYDLNRARALLKEAGYNGEPVELMFNVGDDETEATVVQAQLKRIGMNVKLGSQERGANLARRRAGNYAFKLAGGSINLDPLRGFIDDFKCEGDPRKRVENETGYCDKEMESLFKKAEAEVDAAKRKLLIKQIVTKLNEELPELRVGFVPRFFAVRDYVKGFTSDSTNSFRWWGGGLNYVWLDK
jgi:peptide/nickel transport system substrate-binding protein